MNRSKRLPVVVPACVLGLMINLSHATTAESAGEGGLSWEQVQLFDPSDALVRAESKGRVTIYDGVYQEDVDRAMDEQFDRIDRMMFIRTMHRADTGGYYADDDCD